MGIFNTVTRRAMLASQAALGGLAFLPSLAAAKTIRPIAEATTEAAATSTTPALPPRWDTATAEELAAFVGQRFRVSVPNHGTIALELVGLEAGQSGADRPADLPRRESVVAIFDSPDLGPLAEMGEGTFKVHNPRIGSAHLHLTAGPRENGGHYIETVLN